jgi:hypothetical protein
MVLVVTAPDVGKVATRSGKVAGEGAATVPDLEDFTKGTYDLQAG